MRAALLLLTSFLYLTALPAHAGPGQVRALAVMGGTSNWPAANAINGITAVTDTGPTDTGTQSGVMSAGAITVDAECASFSGGSASQVQLYVDGALRDGLYCDDGASDSGTLSFAVSAGLHSARVVGAANPSCTFTGDNFSIPAP